MKNLNNQTLLIISGLINTRLCSPYQMPEKQFLTSYCTSIWQRSQKPMKLLMVLAAVSMMMNNQPVSNHSLYKQRNVKQYSAQPRIVFKLIVLDCFSLFCLGLPLILFLTNYLE